MRYWMRASTNIVIVYRAAAVTRASEDNNNEIAAVFVEHMDTEQED